MAEQDRSAAGVGRVCLSGYSIRELHSKGSEMLSTSTVCMFSYRSIV